MAGTPDPRANLTRRAAALGHSIDDLEQLVFNDIRRSPASKLTTSEITVMRTVARASSRKAAEELSLAISTIDTHVKSVCRKLGVSGRRDALDILRRDGLL